MSHAEVTGMDSRQTTERTARQLSFDDELDKYNQEASALAERPVRFMSTSSAIVERLYTPADFREQDYAEKLGFPGSWPYTRGVHATGYRGRLWTMRMFAGFG